MGEKRGLRATYMDAVADHTGEIAADLIRMREALGPAVAAEAARLVADTLTDLARDFERQVRST